VTVAAPSLDSIVGLYKERVTNLNELADVAEVFYIDLQPKAELLAKHLTSGNRYAGLIDFRCRRDRGRMGECARSAP
jgi:hypothetical protein